MIVKKGKFILLVLSGFALALSLVAYTTTWAHEEIFFAQGFLTSPQGPEYQPGLRIDGADVYVKPGHPGPLSHFFSSYGAVVHRFYDLNRLDFDTQTFAVRIAFAMLHIVLWAIALLWLLPLTINGWLFGAILISIFSPVSILMGVYVGFEPVVGFLLCGLLSLVALANRQRGLWYAVPFLVCSFLLGFLGKQEWGFAFLVALVIAFILVTIFPSLRSDGDRGRSLRMVVYPVVFLLIGSYWSLWYDPENYFASLHVLVGVSGGVGSAWNSSWVAGHLLRTPHLLVPILSIALSAMLMAKYRELRCYNRLILLLFASFLFAGYFISPLNLTRYYALTHVVSAVLLIEIVSSVGAHAWVGWVRKLFLSAGVALVLVAVAFYGFIILSNRSLIDSLPKHIFDLRDFEPSVEYARKKKCLLVLHPMDGLRLPHDVGWVNNGFGPDDREAYAQKYHTKLCAINVPFRYVEVPPGSTGIRQRIKKWLGISPELFYNE